MDSQEGSRKQAEYPQDLQGQMIPSTQSVTLSLSSQKKASPATAQEPSVLFSLVIR